MRITEEIIKEFTIFSDTFLYKKFMIGYKYQSVNTTDGKLKEKYTFYLTTHNKLYEVDAYYITEGYKYDFYNFKIKEIINPIKYSKYNEGNATNKKVRYAIYQTEIFNDEFVDIFMHFFNRSMDNIEIEKWLDYFGDMDYTRNDLAQCVNYELRKIKGA